MTHYLMVENRYMTKKLEKTMTTELTNKYTNMHFKHHPFLQC